MFKMYSFRNYRIRLCLYVIGITVIGVMVVGSARQSLQNRQIMGMALGLFCLLVLSLIDYSFLLKLVWPIYFANIGLLVAVILKGTE